MKKKNVKFIFLSVGGPWKSGGTTCEAVRKHPAMGIAHSDLPALPKNSSKSTRVKETERTVKTRVKEEEGKRAESKYNWKRKRGTELGEKIVVRASGGHSNALADRSGADKGR